MRIESDIIKAKEFFPNARSKCLYTSVDLNNKSNEVIRKDFEISQYNISQRDSFLPDIEGDNKDKRIKIST